MALAELTKLIGQPGNWKPPSGDNALALALANVLDKRRCPEARPILAAAKMKRSSPYWFLFRYIRATARDSGR